MSEMTFLVQLRRTIGGRIDSDAYSNSSLLMLSGSAAQPFLRECSAFWVSDALIGMFKGCGSPVKGSRCS